MFSRWVKEYNEVKMEIDPLLTQRPLLRCIGQAGEMKQVHTKPLMQREGTGS